MARRAHPLAFVRDAAKGVVDEARPQRGAQQQTIGRGELRQQQDGALPLEARTGGRRMAMG